jgi:hypothetical protein
MGLVRYRNRQFNKVLQLEVGMEMWKEFAVVIKIALKDRALLSMWGLPGSVFHMDLRKEEEM